MTAKALLDREPQPSRDRIREALSGNLCRCTGYQQIIEAVEAASTALAAPAAEEVRAMTSTSAPRRRASRAAASTGAPRSQARRGSRTTSSSAHAALPAAPLAACRTRASSASTPRRPRRIPASTSCSPATIVPDSLRRAARQPRRARALPRQGAVRRRSRGGGDRPRRSDRRARRCELIDVEYEPLRTFASPEDSLAHPEPRIHDYGDEGNIHKIVALQFGDVDDGIAGADHVFDDVFFFEGNTHLPLEQHAARRAEGSRRQARRSTRARRRRTTCIARWPRRCRCRRRTSASIATPNGGGFGGKSDPFNHEIVVAKAAMLLDRPVKFCLNARRGLLLPSRPPSGADALPHGRDERRPHHRHGPADAARRRRVRIVRRRQHVLYRRAADGDLPDSDATASAAAACSRTSRRAVRSEVTARRRAGSARKCSSTRSPSGSRSIPPTCGSTSSRRRLADRQLSSGRIDRTGGVHPPRRRRARAGSEKFRKLPNGRGFGLACSSYLSGAGLPINWNDLPHSGVQLKLDRSGGITAFCGATEIGQGSDDVLVACVCEVLGVEPVRRARGDRRHRSDASRSRILFEPRHADDGQRRDAGGGARARDSCRRGGARSWGSPKIG